MDELATLTRRLNQIIDHGQVEGDGSLIAEAGVLLRRLTRLRQDLGALDQEIAALESHHTARRRGGKLERRPFSFLLLPASGRDSSNHFKATVERPVSVLRVSAWCADHAEQIKARIVDRLAVWGLRDNTRGFPGRGPEPMIWKRIGVGTMALFSDSRRYFCAANVIGTCRSDNASLELWGSDEFRWLILMTDIRDVDVPLDAVVAGAGFDPSYRINRQAVVPRGHREVGLWATLQRHGVSLLSSTPSREEG